VGTKLVEDKLAEDKLAEDKLAEDKLAEDKLAEDKLAEGQLAEDKLAEGQLRKYVHTPSNYQNSLWMVTTRIKKRNQSRASNSGVPQVKTHSAEVGMQFKGL
jgi:hypothetical protein